MGNFSGDDGKSTGLTQGRTLSGLPATGLLMGLASMVLLSPLYASLEFALPLGRYGLAGVVGIAALVVGIAVRWRVVRGKTSAKAARPASIGALCGAITVAVATVQVFLAFHTSYHPKSSSCLINLVSMRMAFEMFANDHDGHLFAELARSPGRLIFSNEAPDAVYPHYVGDLRYLICPHDPGWPPEGTWSDANIMIAHSSYYYLGYVVTNDEEVEAFAKAYRERLAQGARFNTDLSVSKGSGTGGGDFLRRLCYNADQLTVANSDDADRPCNAGLRIPILIERIGHHQPAGGNVIYLDGTTVFLRYPGEWPMTERTIRLLQSLEKVF